ncbi:hypothetical protein ACI3LY_002199 [Candidozyma auris]|uniref:Uncharacterized protein n=1 Tax=Candidozyma auris TaxID=498019 RepID=A0A2H0ZRI2_CANAR|nr:hypothetical protein B9J08_002884 [[Candida] auris]PIS53275.1 hypothetical protein CJI97_002940 [[Candida] auris]
MNIQSVNLPDLEFETDHELTSSDESAHTEFPSISHTKFRIRDHIKSFFNPQHANKEAHEESFKECFEAKASGTQPRSHLAERPKPKSIFGSPTKLLIDTHDDALVYHQLKAESLARKALPYDIYILEWVAWTQRIENGTKEYSTEDISDSKALDGLTESISNEDLSWRKLHILRKEITPTTKEDYSNITVFMKVDREKAVVSFHKVCKSVLLDDLSKPLGITIPIVGITLGKATTEYLIIILWLGNDGEREEVKATHDLLRCLINSIDDEYDEVIKSSVLVRLGDFEVIEMFSGS